MCETNHLLAHVFINVQGNNYWQVNKMVIGDRFDEKDMCNAFEYLMKNVVEVRIFRAKSAKIKKIWIENFLM